MYLALDTETTGLGYWDTAFCASMAWRSTQTGPGSREKLLSSVVYLDTEGAKEVVRLKANSAEGIVFHNAKFDLQKLKLAGVLTEWDWTKIHDTECMSHLINEQQPKALKRLAKELLGLETDEQEALRAARRKLGLKKADGYHALPRDVLEPYARKDAEFTLLLFEHFWPVIEGDPELSRLYREEQLLAEVIFSMESKGLGLDMEYVNEKAKELAGEILESDLRIRELVGVEEFNPASWQQVTAAFAARGISVGSTAKATLASLQDELADEILRLRHNTKLYSSYFKALQAEQRDGVLHPNFKQWGTRGRRYSAGGVDDG